MQLDMNISKSEGLWNLKTTMNVTTTAGMGDYNEVKLSYDYRYPITSSSVCNGISSNSAQRLPDGLSLNGEVPVGQSD